MRALKFGAVGLANTALDVALYGLMTLVAGISPVIANLASYSAGIALSFVVNRAWTFRDRGRAHAGAKLLLFAAGSVAGLALSTAVVALLAARWGALPAKAASLCVTFCWNYLFANRIVFRARASRQPGNPC
jgi:putative flippase GtrA